MKWTAQHYTQPSPFSKDELWGFTLIVDENGDNVATLYSTGRDSIGRDKQQAAARLIENAPVLMEALQTLISEIQEYERINHLSPSPGKRDCWQSVTHAREVLSAVTQEQETEYASTTGN